MLPSSPLIKTNKYLLRPFVDSDIHNVFLGLSHPEIIKYYGVSYDTLIATQEQMTWFKDLEKNNSGIWFAVCDLDNIEFYGAIGLNNLMQLHQKAEIGFWLLPAYWGKGVMQLVIPAICDYAFKELKLHRLEAFVETENHRCKGLLHQLDFIHEGTMHDTEIKNGEFISLDIYAKLYPSP